MFLTNVLPVPSTTLLWSRVSMVLCPSLAETPPHTHTHTPFRHAVLCSPPVVTIAGQRCSVNTSTLSFGSLECTAPPRSDFASPSSTVVVTVDGQSSNTVPLAYDRPVVTAVAPDVIDAAVAGATTRATLQVLGRNFGVPPLALDGGACTAIACRVVGHVPA